MTEMESYQKSSFEHKVCSQYWIDSDGVIRKYSGGFDNKIFSIHLEIASNCFPLSKSPESCAERSGWIKVSSSPSINVCAFETPTQTQINTLFDIGLYYDLMVWVGGRFINFDKYKYLF